MNLLSYAKSQKRKLWVGLSAVLLNYSVPQLLHWFKLFSFAMLCRALRQWDGHKPRPALFVTVLTLQRSCPTPFRSPVSKFYFHHGMSNWNMTDKEGRLHEHSWRWTTVKRGGRLWEGNEKGTPFVGQNKRSLWLGHTLLRLPTCLGTWLVCVANSILNTGWLERLKAWLQNLSLHGLVLWNSCLTVSKFEKSHVWLWLLRCKIPCSIVPWEDQWPSLLFAQAQLESLQFKATLPLLLEGGNLLRSQTIS